MSQKYQFPTSFPAHILSLMISNTVNYGHIIILTGEGIVYQNGAVQTVIVKHYSATDGKIFYMLPVIVCKVRKRAKIRNRYNQAPHLTQDTKGKVTTSQLDITNESQEVSPFPAVDHKASINRHAQKHNKYKTEIT